MIVLIAGLSGVLFRTGCVCCGTGGPFGLSSKCYQTLCNEIAMFARFGVDLTEQFVGAMNDGPLTFQWACLACVVKSIASERRACRSSTADARTLSGKVFFVACMVSFLLSSLDLISGECFAQQSGHRCEPPFKPSIDRERSAANERKKRYSEHPKGWEFPTAGGQHRDIANAIVTSKAD